jgi:hypothetical protein
VGKHGVPELVQGPAVQIFNLGSGRTGMGEAAGGLLEQLRCPAVGQPVTGHRSAVATARAGFRLARNTGPWRRPSSRGSSRAVPVCKCTHSAMPPLETTRAHQTASLVVTTVVPAPRVRPK